MGSAPMRLLSQPNHRRFIPGALKPTTTGRILYSAPPGRLVASPARLLRLGFRGPGVVVTLRWSLFLRLTQAALALRPSAPASFGSSPLSTAFSCLGKRVTFVRRRFPSHWGVNAVCRDSPFSLMKEQVGWLLGPCLWILLEERSSKSSCKNSLRVVGLD